MWPFNKPTMKITPYPDNAKKHTPEQIAKIAASIERFGMNQPIVVDSQGFIIVGHGRFLALQHLGLEVKPEWVKTVEGLSDAEVKAYRIADNKLNESEWDISLVVEELHNLKGIEEELVSLTGFDDLKLTDYEPNYKPDDSPYNTSQEEIDKKAKELAEQMTKEALLKEITCPECGHEFKING